MIDDIQRFEFLGREFEEYMKALSASTVNLEIKTEDEVNPAPSLSEQKDVVL